MNLFEGIDHVQLAAPPGCEADARRFYGEWLGLPEVPKPPDLAARGGCWFLCGPQQVHIGVEQDFRPAKKAHPGLRLRDAAALDVLRARLAAHGVAITEDRAQVPGTHRIFVSDPFGNRLEILAAAPPVDGLD